MSGEKIPAVYVNLFTIQCTSDGVARIVFSDAIAGTNGEDRVAVAMSIANVEMLADTIKGLLQQVRDQAESAAATKQ